MVRYIKNNELCHHGTLGQKWGRRLYQNPDGSLTPLGREHYGYGKKDDRAPVDRRLAKLKAFNETIKQKLSKNYKYTYKKPQNKEDTTQADRAEKAREAKAQKKLETEAKAEFEKEKKEEKENKAKQNRWEEFTDDELRRYAERVLLEDKANQALRTKLDAPRKILELIVDYGSTGVKAYTTYKQVFEIIENHNKEHVPDTSEALARTMLESIKKDLGPTNDISKMNKDTLQKYIEIIGKVNAIEELTKPKSKMQNLGKNNNNNNNKGK